MLNAKTVREWSDLAKRDDCLVRFVPSDIRQMLGEINRMDALLAKAADALNNGARMSEMDLGSKITEYRRSRQTDTVNG